jgi:hypothetical protein
VAAIPLSRDAFTPGWTTARTPPVKGTFEIHGLLDLHLIRATTPRGWFLKPLDFLEPGEETDRARLDRWKLEATRVTVTDEQPAAVTLKLLR